MVFGDEGKSWPRDRSKSVQPSKKKVLIPPSWILFILLCLAVLALGWWL
jgi:hypothetical protein